MNADQKKIYTRKITNANKTQMITILYEMVLDYLHDATRKLEKKDYKAFSEEIKKAQNCIDELIQSTNMEYELGRNLRGIYFFEKKQLLKASYKREKEHIDQAESVFKKLHEAYLKLEKKDSSRPIMENTQEVYAGMTYGRYSLLENMTFNSNRGFMA